MIRDQRFKGFVWIISCRKYYGNLKENDLFETKINIQMIINNIFKKKEKNIFKLMSSFIYYSQLQDNINFFSLIKILDEL